MVLDALGTLDRQGRLSKLRIGGSEEIKHCLCVVVNRNLDRAT
jgi:hypothetical protein